MGNLNTACHVSNYSKRNVRMFVTEKALELDAFIASRPAGDGGGEIPPAVPGGKTFSFRTDVDCVRVLASQTQQVPGDARRFLSVFVEDEDDGGVCSKQIAHNVALSGAVTFLLYDV